MQRSVVKQVSKPLDTTSRFLRRYFRASGLAGALLAFSFALTPSLLPRPPLYMGALAGISAGIGYGLGLLTGNFLRWAGGKHLSPRSRVVAWRVIIVITPVVVVTMGFAGSHWQNDVRLLVGEAPYAGNDILKISFITLVFFTLVLTFARAVRYIYGVSRRRVTGRLPRWIGVTLSVLMIYLLGVLVFKDVAYNTFVRVANNSYAARNASTPEGARQPSSTLRSGSKDSLVPWESIGYQGKKFVSSVPTSQEISSWSNAPAQEQIRVYVGVKTRPSAEQRARLALDELKRTGAFERRYLIVTTPTGTGWIEPQSADATAYLTNGNSAIAAIQYSYLPSWISFLVDKQNATEAGKELYDTIFDYWKTLPSESRPQLVAYGLSLGSFGGQAAFSGQSDMQTRTQGAIFVGSPHDSQPWHAFTNDREPGSPQILPVYERGQHVRFAANIPEIQKNHVDWQPQRILYLQHASDPIVWWTPELLVSAPDWLKEPRGSDVSANTRWIPVVTFLQVSVDQFFGTTVPIGHGHNYSDIMVYAFNAVFEDMPWNDSQIHRLQSNIDAYATD